MKQNLRSILPVTIDIDHESVESIKFLLAQGANTLLIEYPSETIDFVDGAYHILLDQEDTASFRPGKVFIDTFVRIAGAQTHPETKIGCFEMHRSLFDLGDVEDPDVGGQPTVYEYDPVNIEVLDLSIIKGKDGAEGKSPYISDHGTWMVWDTEQQEWTDTEVRASLLDKSNSIIIGENNESISQNSIIIGDDNTTESVNILAIGEMNRVAGMYSVAIGSECETAENASFAQGNEAKALGDCSHAEGNGTTASGGNAHAEGAKTEASGMASHTEGSKTIASGNDAHAEGNLTKAVGRTAHAEGRATTANGERSHAEGFNTIADGKDQHVQGHYNIADENLAHIVGNGDYNDDGEIVRSNAHTLDWGGNAWFAGDVYVGSESCTNRDDGSEKLVTLKEVSKIVEDAINALKQYYIDNPPKAVLD